MATRLLVLLLAFGLLAFAAAATPAAAMRDPVGNCNEDATVEVCFPVCVTEPCYGYVCAHLNAGDVCLRP